MSPEPRIWVLPPEVAERIAAGEVVERPASAAKELVENALDAGARRVTVEAEGGGKRLLRVTDDGGGMSAAEARLALQRHATSKLRAADDLFDLHTFGFRGEALPSIAAVSDLEIVTRTPDAAEGTRLRVVAGEVCEECPTGARPGTTVTVQRLFFNVPVREKFLRSDTAEAGHITEWLQRLALARPDVTFRLIHDGREALLSPASGDALNAVVAVLGRPVARDLLRVESPAADSDELRVTGFAGRPTLTRANRALQHTYVNGRAVRSPILYRALDDAFRSSMPQGRHPVAVLFLELPPGTVDVNVHPAKTEVRFQDEAAVHGAVLRAVREALRSAAAGCPLGAAADRTTDTLSLDAPPPGAPRVGEPEASAAASPPPSPGSLPFAEAAIGGPVPPSWRDRPPRASSPPGAGGPSPAAHPRPESARDDPFAAGDRPLRAWNPAPAAEPLRGSAVPAAAVDPTDSLARPGAAPAIPPLTLLGQARDLFILAEGGGRLWVIDQHVAHERVLFDRITAPATAAESGEPLLLPAVLEVDRAQSLALDEHRELLGGLGFQVEPFGPGRYALRAVPRALVGRGYENAFRDLVDELAERSRGGQERLDREGVAAAAAGRACKRAVKAGQRLAEPELQRLLEELREARNPHTCPHGRPVFLTFSPEELAALFGPRHCG